MEEKQTVNYVDPEQFFQDMLAFREKRGIDPKCKIPNSIASAILLIGKNVVKHPKFMKFKPIRDDMTSQAVENCIRYINNWNPEFGKPFGYFSTIAFYACLKVVRDEKFEYLKRHEVARRHGIETLFEEALKNGGENLEAIEEGIYTAFSGRIPDREMTFGVKEEWPAEAPRQMRRKTKKAVKTIDEELIIEVAEPIDIEEIKEQIAQDKKFVAREVKTVYSDDTMDSWFDR